MQPMSFDDAVAAIVAKTRLSDQDVRDLTTLSVPELTVLITSYRDADLPMPRSEWDTVLEVLGVVSQVASVVLPLTGVVNSVYTLVKNVKG